MTNYFEVSEFHKPQFVLTKEIETKIQHHIDILNPIREKLGIPIRISKRSGYRPKIYELSRGRSGNSQHTFKGKGAVDLTCKLDQLQLLFELLQESEYTRICLYVNKNFIHADMKEINGSQQVFICTDLHWELYT